MLDSLLAEIKRERSEHLISPDMVTTESESALARRLQRSRILESNYSGIYLRKEFITMRILLAEDDRDLNKALTWQLNGQGYSVDSCYDGDEALYYGEQNIYDVILLDRMLPCREGTEVLTALRQQAVNVPIILITALGTLQDKIVGLDLGADDYLVKPFEFEELLARIRCVSRRSTILNAEPDTLTYHDITWSGREMSLTGPTGSSTLSKREGSLLESFLHMPEQTIARETLLLKVWGPDSDVEDGNLDNYVYFLRRRLKTVGSRLQIKTVRGVGYKLVQVLPPPRKSKLSLR